MNLKTIDEIVGIALARPDYFLSEPLIDEYFNVKRNYARLRILTNKFMEFNIL